MILSFQGISPEVHRTAFIASTASVIGRVEVRKDASVWFGAVVRGDQPSQVIHIGEGANVQDNVVIHVSAESPTVIEDHATIGHGAVLESCRVGARTVVGMNAVVLQGADVGPGCLVAAGAVVKSGARVPEGSLVAGVPGRVRPLTPGARAWIEGSAEHYIALARVYLAERRRACDLCGGPVLERHCKVTCLNCGYQRDCSDP